MCRKAQERKDEMKRSISILLAVVLAAALLLGFALQANARTIRTDVGAYEYVCLTDPGSSWVEGDVLHIRGIQHTNVDVSDVAELNGLNTTIASGDINLKTGYAAIRGTMSFQPQGLQGTWEGTWTFTGNPGGARGRAVAHGTGVLAGKSLFLDLYDAPYDPVGTAEACAGIGEPESNTDIQGYILDPGDY
jgi:hypothetical protein